MAIRPDWTIGTLTLAAGSKNFTTIGSALVQAQVHAGDEIITASGDILIIEAVTGDNAGTLYHPCPAASTGLDQPLRIRFQPDGSRYSAAARDLIEQLGNGNLHAFSQLLGGVDKVPYFTGAGVMDLIDLSSLGGGGSGGGSWDALTGTLIGRDAFNGEAAGFRVLVANNGNGQAVIYQKTGPAAANWSTSIPFTGAKGDAGPANTLAIGSISEGSQAQVTITGTPPNQVVNFVLQRGEKGEVGDVTPEALAAKAAAEAAANAAAQDAVRTAADRVATGQDKAATAADRVVTTADKQATGQDKAATAADRTATGLDRAATAADRQATAADKARTTADAATATTKAAEADSNAALTAADRVATGQDKNATASDKTATAADRVATGQDRAVTGADKTATTASALAAASSATSANNSKVDAQSAALVSDERATISTNNAATTITQAGIATAAATQVTADKQTITADKAMVAADKASVSTNTAATVAARDKAQEWANAPEGQVVEAGQYSAYHWSKVAEIAAGGGVQMVNGHTGAVITLDASDVGAATAAQGELADTALQALTAGTNIAITGSGTSLAISATFTPQVQADWNATSGLAAIANKPTLATVATTGAYDDLSGRPTIPAAQVNADWNSTSGISQIRNKPTLGTAAYQNDGAFATAAQGAKADSAVQPAALNAKQDKLTGTALQITLGNGSASDSIPANVLGLTYNTTSEISVAVTPPMWMYVTDGTNYGLKQIQNLPITKGQVGLGSVDNTSDAAKPISTATQSALNGKLATGGKAADSSLLNGKTAAQLPVSTATQNALNGKQDQLNFTPVNKAGDTGLAGFSAAVTPTSGNIVLSSTNPQNVFDHTNVGAMTITAPSTAGTAASFMIFLTNSASAGSVAFVGFATNAVKGDTITTTAGKIYCITVGHVGANAAAFVSELN